MAGITFAMYEIYGKQTGAPIFKTPSALHNLDDFRTLLSTHKGKVGVVFLCLPNNPLGECLDAQEVKNFLGEIDPNILVVVDGAYQEYARYKDPTKALDPKELIAKFPNVLYLGTFSKAYGPVSYTHLTLPTKRIV